MKFIKGVVITLVVILVVVVLVGGYLGFIPVVSDLFGSNKPKDLGVTYTPADFKSARTKTGTTLTDLPANASPEQSIKFSGQKPINATFTQAEINALIDNPAWKYYPLSDCQLKINPDNTAEFSGILRIDRLDGYATAMKFSKETVNSVKDYLKAVPGNPAFYMKGIVSVTNGQISSNITEVQVGKLSIPADQSQVNKGFVSFFQTQMASIPGFSCKNFKMVNGQLQFEGTVPNSWSRSKS